MFTDLMEVLHLTGSLFDQKVMDLSATLPRSEGVCEVFVASSFLCKNSSHLVVLVLKTVRPLVLEELNLVP